MDDDFKVGISVIIPTRNEEDYIEKCIDSLLNCRTVEASGFNVEFIIVDGMSTDRTVGIVKEKFEPLLHINTLPLCDVARVVAPVMVTVEAE